MLCPACGNDNPLEARFCGHCGSAQTMVVRHPTVDRDGNGPIARALLAGLQKKGGKSGGGLLRSTTSSAPPPVKVVGSRKHNPWLGPNLDTAIAQEPINQISTTDASAKHANLRLLAGKLASLAQSASPKVNTMLESATLLGPGGQPWDCKDLNKYLFMDGLVLAATFSKLSGRVSDATAEFAMALCDATRATVIVHPEMLASIKTSIQEMWDKVSNNPVEPLTLTVLSLYDQQFGTQYCATARDLFSQCIAGLAEEDNSRSDTTRSLFAQYNAVLSFKPEKLYEASIQAASSGKEAIPAETCDSLMAELLGLIGLDKVKKDVVELADYIKVQQMRKSHGLKTTELSLHMVFYGNPGTGKTTVARLLARIYKSLGVASQGHLVETDRSGMVAGYIGQTALKVKELVERAVGGILFVDEAYALKPRNASGDFGDEAIQTLLKLMEDKRGNLIVVVAGYPAEMEYFLRSNPGLQSRFNKYLTFDDYTPDELLQIFQRFCVESEYKLDGEGESKLKALFESAFQHRDEHFGNARYARNAFEQALRNMAARIVNLTSIDDSTLQTIRADDIPSKITSGPTTDLVPAT